MSGNAKAVVGCFGVVLAVFIAGPIWYYLLYRILQAVHADTPMWIAYWVYVPVSIIAGMVAAIVKEMEK